MLPQTLQLEIVILILLAVTLFSSAFHCCSFRLQATKIPNASRTTDCSRMGMGGKDIPQGPGETDLQPMSSAKVSKIELAKLVVSSAVLYITIQLNVEKAVAKWLPDGLGASSVTVLEDGIKFEDIVIGNGVELCRGDEFEAECRLFYNGLEIENIPLNGGIGELQDDSNLMVATYQQNAIEKPMSGIMRGISGLKVGGRRKIVLAPEHAFGDEGVSPYIPPGANVLYDLKLLRITDKLGGKLS